MTRKIVQISSAVSIHGGLRRETVYALDSDGQVWAIDPYDSGSRWSELPALPPSPEPKPNPGADIRRFATK